MLPQTSIQLYRILIEQNACDASLSAVRASYDVARTLFAGHYRPSHKTFVSHLVGTAGALAMWGQRVELVAAGMLHSAYLYGNFGDGEVGYTPRHSAWLCDVLGDEVESLVAGYTRSCWKRPLTELVIESQQAPLTRDLFTVKLADTLDELCDGGPGFAPRKPLEFGLDKGDDQASELISAVRGLLGPTAAGHFQLAIASSRVAVPEVLETSDRSFHCMPSGIPELRRTAIQRRWDRLRHKIAPPREAA